MPTEKPTRPNVEKFESLITTSDTGGDWKRGRAIDQLCAYIRELEREREALLNVVEAARHELFRQWRSKTLADALSALDAALEVPDAD